MLYSVTDMGSQKPRTDSDQLPRPPTENLLLTGKKVVQTLCYTIRSYRVKS